MAMLHHVLAAVAVVLALLAAAASSRAPAWPDAFEPPTSAPGCIGRAVFQVEQFHSGRKLAHATSAVLLRDGRLRAVWYEGSKELARNVQIWTATFDGSRWSRPRAIVNADTAAAGTGRFIAKLGNPLIFRNASGALVLLFAAAGIGGWDGVSLKAMHSRDDGKTWSAPRNLTTAAIYNLGTNVRGPAVAAAGGVVLIPTSHEFIKPFPELVMLDAGGRVVGKRRIGVAYGGTQPFVLVRDRRHATAFMRVKRGFTLLSSTDDAGASWNEPTPTNSINRDTPVAVTRIGDKILMVHSKRDESSLRWALAFSISDDGGANWHEIHSEPFGPGPRDIPKYPWLIVGSDGLYHVLFTSSHADGHSELMHARFSRDWIAQRGGPPCR
jgi:predicted neuraminidase